MLFLSPKTTSIHVYLGIFLIIWGETWSDKKVRSFQQRTLTVLKMKVPRGKRKEPSTYGPAKRFVFHHHFPSIMHVLASSWMLRDIWCFYAWPISTVSFFFFFQHCLLDWYHFIDYIYYCVVCEYWLRLVYLSVCPLLSYLKAENELATLHKVAFGCILGHCCLRSSLVTFIGHPFFWGIFGDCFVHFPVSI